MGPQLDLQAHLPLTEATLYIMLSLAPGPKHGYAVMKDVEALSEGQVVLSTGTLYGAIKRLLDNGWIRRVEEPDPDPPPDAADNSNGAGRPRKSYILTRTGRRVLEAEVDRLGSLVAVARLRVVKGGA
jgi:DNA-binding PadR family transcriptional regulator